MKFSTVSEWLSWIALLHPKDMDLGLDRVKEVAKRLQLLSPPCSVIIVGGTNGKGSTVAGLESIYQTCGYQVGAFTSPFLFKHNEQVRVNQGLASDAEFCDAFAKVNHARGDISLTSFEFFTLAALLIFQSYSLDVMILEVGLGGRLDAVNIIDADVSVVTSISIDHTEWLGDTREKIASEKAGIFRKGKPAVCGDTNPPLTLIEAAASLGANLYCQGRDFTYEAKPNEWSWHGLDKHYDHLPLTQLAIQNMSTVLMVITLLQPLLPVTRAALDKGLSQVTLPGRVQVIPGAITEIYDVSHNPASIAYLAGCLTKMACQGKTYAVFSMLADKDLVESINSIRDRIDAWYVAPLIAKRAASTEQLIQVFQQTGIDKVIFYSSLNEAYQAVRKIAGDGDRIVVFGSFHSVAEINKL